jgi:hypothetical protein
MSSNKEEKLNQSPGAKSAFSRISKNEMLSEILDHNTEKFADHINQLLSYTPLPNLLQEARDKEKRFPTFQYIPP